MENIEKIEKEEVFDEARTFLEETKEVIIEAKKLGKEVVYASDDLLILSLEEGSHIVYEVYNKTGKILATKLVYIGDAKLKSSYLLNLIHKQEIKHDPRQYTKEHF